MLPGQKTSRLRLSLLSYCRNKESCHETSMPSISASGRGRCRVPALPRLAHAQAYPTRPITVLVFVGAGGTPDIIARVIGQALPQRLRAVGARRQPRFAWFLFQGTHKARVDSGDKITRSFQFVVRGVGFAGTGGSR
jgi:hypothetical protein